MIRGQSDNDNVRFAGRLTRILPLSLAALPRRRSGLGEGRGEGNLIVQSHQTPAFYGHSVLRTPHSALRTPHSALRTPHSALRTGFTLLEVMIACGIFFMATFAILGLVSNTLRNARGIQRIEVDAGMAAAQVYQTLRTNRQAELSLSGDFGDSYRDYSWEAESSQFDTNGMLIVNIVVSRRGFQKPVDAMSLLVFAPDAKSSFGSPGR